MYRISFVHSLVDRHLGCFYFWAVKNTAAMGAPGWLSWLNIWLLVLAQVMISSHEIEPRVRLCTGRGVCLGFSLSLSLSLSLCPSSVGALCLCLCLSLLSKKKKKRVGCHGMPWKLSLWGSPQGDLTYALFWGWSGPWRQVFRPPAGG